MNLDDFILYYIIKKILDLFRIEVFCIINSCFNDLLIVF